MKNKEKKILGLIGARSGSKGVPDKNIKDFNGKPLLGNIIEKAKNSKFINRLIVSTDSKNYSEIAQFYGAEVPCLRPKSLAEDFSPEIDFVKHMVNFLKNEEDYKPDIVVRMMVTPCLFKCLTFSHRFFLSSTSTPAVGSSSIRIGG